MGGTAARIGDETEDLFQVQLCGFRRVRSAATSDHFILNGAQVDNGQTQDAAAAGATDVTYVSRTLFQVFIIQFFQAVA
ncbi:hypothetical protein [Enterobacter roggenkampii]|uniref:hypothetical protein n=1 Tax=Enterobacter roggenkampii TaxID=1812935 RepID=UPI003CC914E1